MLPLLFGTGEPSIQPGLQVCLLGLGVLLALGVGNALAAYAGSIWLYRCTLE